LGTSAEKRPFSPLYTRSQPKPLASTKNRRFGAFLKPDFSPTLEILRQTTQRPKSLDAKFQDW